MTVKIEGILIDSRRHSDRNDIVTLFTRSHGRMAFVSAAGDSKSGRLRRARLQPLTIVAANINICPNRDLQTLRTFDVAEVCPSIYFNPVKRSIALFLAEFLNRLLRMTAPDPDTFDALRNGIIALDTASGSLANFHIAFLASLLPPMGIYPDFSGIRPGYFFDMTNGAFSPFRPSHKAWLSGDDASLFTCLAGLSLTNHEDLQLTRAARQRLLSFLLNYYDTHFPGSASLNSPAILADVFRS